MGHSCGTSPDFQVTGYGTICRIAQLLGKLVSRRMGGQDKQALNTRSCTSFDKRVGCDMREEESANQRPVSAWEDMKESGVVEGYGAGKSRALAAIPKNPP